MSNAFIAQELIDELHGKVNAMGRELQTERRESERLRSERDELQWRLDDAEREIETLKRSLEFERGESQRVRYEIDDIRQRLRTYSEY